MDELTVLVCCKTYAPWRSVSTACSTALVRVRLDREPPHTTHDARPRACSGLSSTPGGAPDRRGATLHTTEMHATRATPRPRQHELQAVVCAICRPVCGSVKTGGGLEPAIRWSVSASVGMPRAPVRSRAKPRRLTSRNEVAPASAQSASTTSSAGTSRVKATSRLAYRTISTETPEQLAPC